ncbi:phosphoribosyltransferase family protein [Capnocytophaga catalasegens]|uniref:Phosphoribosyltransferase n=1 Tax=Capnocytophaga catalasegens TaxID=1004260 RepID=A0AAV5AVL5_9FLAO|nr:phosphoribosyltransferase family protein [Capnocytophaga catalasegens]GIZ15036.1 phosphoribosyltransferase [Capnocytophaga catalasegens]GJM49416.1 phosphoribosyltransferase [Capnocytophaga catalasegens]GJM52566.1 phosphoribosyltransferase [Capnocytophaga catalasegens]
MTIILNSKQIQHKIRRIAYQIYEANLGETEFILAGIEKNGYIFAEKLYQELTSVCSIRIKLCKVSVNKKNPLDEVKTSLSVDQYTNLSVVLVDDVLNSGSTLIYGIKHFLNVPLKDFKTAVLVNRNHKKYPVKADFKGISLSTSLQEHVSVSFDNEPVVFLE